MLNVNIQGNIEVTKAIEDHIHASSQDLQKYTTAVLASVDVHLKKEHKTKFTVVLNSTGKSCTASSENMYHAITKAFEKMETILSKDKSVKLHKRNNPVQLDLTEDEE